ncbi:unnamed protein product [Camellia sinensis]
MFPSFYILLFGGDDDIDDGEIASFINSEIHYHFYFESKPTEDEVQERSRPKICIIMALGS